MLKLNFGCGRQHLPGYINIDISAECKPDTVWDITKSPYPIDWMGAERIEMDNLAEHIEAHTLIKVINEIHRILKPGGTLWMRTPHVRFTPEHLRAAFTDPTHINYFTLDTFQYWDKDHKRHKAFGRDYGILPWKVIRNEEWSENNIFLIVELQK